MMVNIRNKSRLIRFGGGITACERTSSAGCGRKWRFSEGRRVGSPFGPCVNLCETFGQKQAKIGKNGKKSGIPNLLL